MARAGTHLQFNNPPNLQPIRNTIQHVAATVRPRELRLNNRSW